MAEVRESTLEYLFERACSSHFNEAKFYAHLMRSMVYVHVPVSDDSTKVRLIQFRHPGGFDAIPLFTSLHRSARAASNAVKVRRVPCIELLNATLGATLMINPNDGGPVLYPEEVTALLENGTLESFEKIEEVSGSWDLRLAESPLPTIVEALRAGAASTSFIKHVYLLEKRAKDRSSDDFNLLVYLGAESAYLERAARYVVQVLHNLSPRPHTAIDVAVYDLSQSRPEFLNQMGAVPIFGLAH